MAVWNQTKNKSYNLVTVTVWFYIDEQQYIQGGPRQVTSI